MEFDKEILDKIASADELISLSLYIENLTYENTQLKKKLRQSKSTNNRLGNRIDELQRCIDDQPIAPFSSEEAYLIKRFKELHVNCDPYDIEYHICNNAEDGRTITLYCDTCGTTMHINKKHREATAERIKQCLYAALEQISYSPAPTEDENE